MDTATQIVGAVVTCGLIAAYVAVTLAGHDGTAVLTALGGYIGGAGFGAARQAAKSAG